MARGIVAVVDLQYGSTGKGQVAGTVALNWKPDTVATAWGPNAGHTFRNGDFQGVSRMLASSATAPSVQNILIGPGSVIDMQILKEELQERGKRHLEGKNLIIHPQAVILRDYDATSEQASLLRIGSTMKGTAEAAIRKIRRYEDVTAGQLHREVFEVVGEGAFEAGMAIVISSYLYDKAIDNSKRLILEGAQGFSLGVHTDFYPHCTGRDVSTAQLFADCRVPWPRQDGPGSMVHVIGVCRTFPIRVANRKNPHYNADSEAPEIFTSGGTYPDQEEISWESLGRSPELTTVTRLPRRIFTFSDLQIRQAVRACGPSTIALTFMDYLEENKDHWKFVDRVERAALAPVRLMSFGPDVKDMRQRNIMAQSLDNMEYIGDMEWLPGGAHDYD